MEKYKLEYRGNVKEFEDYILDNLRREQEQGQSLRWSKFVEVYARQLAIIQECPYPETESESGLGNDETPPSIKLIDQNTEYVGSFYRWGLHVVGIGNFRVIFCIHNYYKVVLLHQFEKNIMVQSERKILLQLKLSMKDFVMKNPKGTKGVFKMSNFFEKYSQIVGQDKVDKIIQEGKIIGQIKSRRMEIGLTQNDLAELIEVPKSTIGRIEAGLTSPRTDTLMKISRALNIPLIIDGRVQQLDKPSVEISLEYTIADAKIDNVNLSSSNDHFYSSFSDYSEPQRGQYVFENANKQNFDMEERQAEVA